MRLSEKKHAITIRLPENLYDIIKDLADEHRRSINNQVIFMLVKWIEKTKSDFMGAEKD